MPKKYFIFFILFIYLSFSLQAFNDTPTYINYIKNSGQWDSKILYEGNFKGGKVFLEKNAFTYLFYPQDGLNKLHPHQKNTQANQKSSAKDGITLNFHTVRMEFLGCEPNATTSQADKQPFYHNYYLGKDESKWVSHVPVSTHVLYNGLYNGISLNTFSRANDVRYDFTVNPNADASVIKLKFTGQNNLSIKDGKLIIGTSVGDMVQEAPYTYQQTDGRLEKIACKYVIEKDIICIKITGNYNHNLPLVIDPTLVFATFSGSTADNWGMSASYDNQGGGYTAGICFATSNTGYVLTPGAFQQTFGGGVVNNTYTYMGFDIVTSKFDPTGSQLLFSTYLGGSDNEQPQSIIVDNNNDLIIYGRSYSSNFPVTNGAYDVSLNGGSDIIITKFNPTGTALIASTFIGGSADDGVNITANEMTLGSLKYNYADDARGDIILDVNNNVYIASCTQSTNFPVTSGCFQSSNHGMQDGCVFKLNASLSSLMWSTYLGGNDDDAAYNLAVDNGNSVYVTGGTESSNFPVTPGALHSSYIGNIDGFLTHISSTGNAVLQSTYIGTSGYDQSYFVQLDNTNNVYIYGQTSGGYPVTAGVYSNANSGQFIHEFNSTLSSTIFSTVFGTGQGVPDIAPSAFLVDKCRNIYISGWGGSLGGFNRANSTTNGLPITSNAFQSTTDGMDFYFMVLQPNAASLWYATYFGGDFGSEEHVDGGTSRFDKTGVIYQAICEGCGANSDMPTTPNAWSTTNNSNNCNNALVKFSFNLVQTVASLAINPSSATGCAPFPVSFTNQSQNATLYSWHFGDGDTSTSISPAHIYTMPGTYTVTLSAKDTATCNILDTMVAVITVNIPPIITVSNATVCVGSNATLTASGASTYTWSTGNHTASISQSPTVTTTYTVTAGINGCVNTATANIVINALPVLTVNSPTICAGNAATLTAGGATTYTWNTTATSSSIIVNPVITTIYTVTGTDNNSCKNKITTTVTVTPSPVITIPPANACIGSTATITASGAITYTWNTGSISPSIVISPTVSTNYSVTGTNTLGCISTKSVTLQVHALPIISVGSGIICQGTSFVLAATGATSYIWSTGATGIAITVSPSVTTTYTIIGADNNNCMDTTFATIVVDPSPTITVNSPSICVGNTATLTAVSSTNNYSWNTGDTTSVIMSYPNATTNYTVWSSNGTCTAYKISTVYVLANHTHLTSGGNIGMCTGDSIKLQTNASYVSYQWNTGQTTPTIDALQAGTYIVQTIDNNGCKGIDSVKVHVDSKVALPLKDTTICSGDHLQLHVIDGYYTYLWLPPYNLNNNTIYNPKAHPTTTIIYTVSVTNGSCMNTNTITVFVNPIPQISVKPKYTVLLEGEVVTLQAQAHDSCNWWPANWLTCSTGCNTTIATAYEDITYTVSTTNSFGCSASTTAKIKLDMESSFYIPNTFSPNGDCINETFKPVWMHIHNYKILIFDRWGLLLFQSDDPDAGWDGMYKSNKCQEDVYVYKATYMDDENNNQHSLAGTVTIVR